MLVLGLDVSTYLGYAFVGDDKVPVTGSIRFEPVDKRYDRYRQYAEEVDHLVRMHEPDAVFTEQFIATAFGSSITIIELGAILRHGLDQRGVPWHEVSPPTLKKFTTGSGHAKKELMLLQVYKRWDFETDDNNVADAFALAKFGRAVLGADDFTSSVKDVVEGYRKKHLTK